MNEMSVRTFLSANSPTGFWSLYPELLKDKKTYIIKGGPGTGKSSLMKKVAATAYRSGFFTEYIYCSSDPQSLDAVYIPELNTVVCDGTAPHTSDPAYAGSEGGIVNVGQCWDEKKLIAAKDDIRGFSDKIKKSYDRAYRYLLASSSAYSDVKKIASQYINKEKLQRFISDFTAVIPHKEGCKPAQKRFLSSFSPEGFLTFKDTVYSAEKVYIINDRYSIASSVLEACTNAASAYDKYVFYDPLSPSDILHLLIPDLGIAIVTENIFTGFEPQNTRRINFSRFLNEDISIEKNKIKFAQKLAKICAEEAINSITHAKRLHDDLEEIYISAMDFNGVGKITDDLISRIFK